MKHKVSLGKSNFKRMIESKSFFVDKSLFIKEVIEEGSEVVLITRPRRFGKSLNFSMLKYFFDIKEDSSELFKGLKISREEESLKHMNKYPVVDIDFKGIDGDNWEGVKRGIYTRISELYSRYWEEVREVIDEEEKKIYKQIIKREPWDVDIVLSLKRLIEYLERRYKENPDKPGVYNMTCDKVDAVVKLQQDGTWEILEIVGRHEQAYERKKVYE